MGWYLRFPSDSGNPDNNKALCQISGISGTLQSVRYKLAESIPSFGSYRYIFDIRRSVDSTADDGGTGWILQAFGVQTAGTSNFRINNSPVDASALFAGAADDVCSFDVNQDPRQGCIAFGCRFNEVESNYGLSVYYIEIVDSAGTHTIDMSSSGGSANEFTSTDGAVTLKLFNFTGSAHWVFYSSGASNSATISGNLPKLVGSITLNEINPINSAAVNGQLPKLAGAVSLLQEQSVTVAGQMPKLTGSASLRLKQSADVSGQLPRMTGSLSLVSTSNNKQIAVTATMPKMTSSIQLSQELTAAVAGTMPRMTADVQLRLAGVYPQADTNAYVMSYRIAGDTVLTASISESTRFSAIISQSTNIKYMVN